MVSMAAAPFTTIFPLLLTILCLGSSQPDLVFQLCGNNNGNYTNGSAYQTNLQNLLSSLPSAVDSFGFANASSTTSGQDPERSYAIALCRGDLQLDDCIKCVNDSISKLPEICPGNKEAVGWYEICMLRYSNRSIAGSLTADNIVYSWNLNNATSVSEFNQALLSLLTELRTKAASGGVRRKFAAGNTEGPDLRTSVIYAMAQCTPDLTEQDCNNCLIHKISRISGCCNGKIGGWIYNPSCFIRYAPNLFYNETAVQALSPPPPPPPPVTAPPTAPVFTGPPPPPTAHSTPPVTTEENKDGLNNKLTILLVVVPVISLLALLTIMIGVSSKLRKSKERDEEGLVSGRRSVLNSEDLNPKASGAANEMRQQQDSVFIQDEDSFQFEFNKLREATNNFSGENQIGKGGFGLVYKGKLPNGEEIAVKRLAQGSKQGEREFKNEITLMVKLHHRNLTKLLGFCLDGKERLLVYEFVPNKSLDHYLFDPIRRMLVNWEARYKIIVGVASGLLYLHEGSRLTVIHHDLKASNVLLDDKMNPRISDFGMSRLFLVDNSQNKTKRIVGTFGYIAPEFANYGQYSVKTDVFSLGVLILEIVTGKSISTRERSEDGAEHLLSYAWQKWRKGKIKSLIDPTIIDGSLSEKMRCLHIGLLCVQESVVKRPTMASVMLMFNSSTISLAIPSKPGFFMNVSTESVMSSRQHGTNQPQTENQTVGSCIYDASFTDPYPR